ncbi:MAG: amino acid transporter [Pseudomonadota bacterium]
MTTQPAAHQLPWQPMNVQDVVDNLRGAPFWWCIAGGIALELATQTRIRAHSDIDVLMLHQDHRALRQHLADWDCWAADPPGTLVPWPCDSTLPPQVHDIWCRRSPTAPWCLQVMLDTGEAEQWRSRRNAKLQMPLSDLTRYTTAGAPFLAPHVQLFYKAKAIRAKDQLDFESLLQSNCKVDWAWLAAAIERTYDPDHPWLRALESSL